MSSSHNYVDHDDDDDDDNHNNGRDGEQNEIVKQSTTKIYVHNGDDDEDEDDEVENFGINVDTDVDSNGEKMMVVEETTATPTAATEIVVPDQVPKRNNNSGMASEKLKCLGMNCSRWARKDCTGSFCIRCCQDYETCFVHKEQRAKTQWKESVMNGTSDIQILAKTKRLRAIPPKRFKEKEFKYMNDTVLLWDLRSVLQPSYPLPTPTTIITTAPTTTTVTILLPSPLPSTSTTTNSNSTTTSNNSTPTPATATATAATTTIVYVPPSSELIAKYHNDSKIKDDILRKSGKNIFHKGVRSGNRKRGIRHTVIEKLYQQSLLH